MSRSDATRQAILDAAVRRDREAPRAEVATLEADERIGEKQRKPRR